MSKPNLPQNAGPVDWAGPECHEATTSGLVHCVRLPQEASLAHPAPVMVMLHGWGGDEGAMWLFKQIISPGVAVITPRAPLDLGDGGYAWFYRNDPLHLTDPDSLMDAIVKLENFLKSHIAPSSPPQPCSITITGAGRAKLASFGKRTQ